MASIVITPATFEAAKFHDPNITPGQDNAIGDVTDQNDRPYFISFAKELTENVHTAGNRAYCDIELDDTACEVLKGLDRTSIGTVQSRSREWFGEEIPLEVVEQFYRSCVSKRRGRDSMFLRVKAGFQKQTAVIKVLENYEEEEEEVFVPEDDIDGGDACEVSTLESYTGRYVEYVVQVRTIRFLKQTFCLEFVLSHIRVPRSKPAPLNLARMIIQTHETAEKRRQYEQKHAELLSLEKLKQEVEIEMENVLKRQKEVTDSYNAVFQEEQCLRAGADWLCTTGESEGTDNSHTVINNEGTPHEPNEAVEECADVTDASEVGEVMEAGEGGAAIAKEEGENAVDTDTGGESEMVVLNSATGEDNESNETTKEQSSNIATACA